MTGAAPDCDPMRTFPPLPNNIKGSNKGNRPPSRTQPNLRCVQIKNQIHHTGGKAPLPRFLISPQGRSENDLFNVVKWAGGVVVFPSEPPASCHLWQKISKFPCRQYRILISRFPHTCLFRFAFSFSRFTGFALD